MRLKAFRFEKEFLEPLVLKLLLWCCLNKVFQEQYQIQKQLAGGVSNKNFSGIPSDFEQTFAG